MSTCQDMQTNEKKILVIDDDPFLLEIIGLRLSKEGHEVVLASSGTEALESVYQQRPDLVLLDAVMPGMSGMEVLRRIKSLDASIPVAVMSGLDEDESRRFLEEGAMKFIPKPIDFQSLKKNVLRQISPAD